MDRSPCVIVDCTGADTVAVLRHRTGRVEALQFDGEGRLPSGVFVADGGEVLTGRAALDAATAAPQRYVPVPLRLLHAGEQARQPDPADLVATVLSQIRKLATAAAGAAVTQAVLVVPPGWGPQRRTRLRTAAHQGGLVQTDLADAATAIAQHLFVPQRSGMAPLPASGPVLVCRLVGGACEAALLARDGDGFAEPAVVDADVPSGLDAQAILARTIEVIERVLRGADAAAGDVGLVALQAPTPYLAGLTGGLRELHITAPVRTVSDRDTLYGALALTTAPAAAPPKRTIALASAVAAGLALSGALVLLWLLQQTGVSLERGAAVFGYPLPAYLYTVWPAWSMVATLVFLGITAATQPSPRRRPGQVAPEDDLQQRRRLARVLHLGAGAALAAGLVTVMLAVASYSLVPVWYLLLWCLLPALLLAGLGVLIAFLVQHGHTSALRWRIWLHFPAATTILGVVGLIVIELSLYAATPAGTLRLAAQLRGVDELGAVFVGLAVLPLVLRRIDHQIVASPFIIAAVLWTHSYSNLANIIGVLLAATLLWWLTRIRPAGAYANPTHPLTMRAAALQRRDPAPTSAATSDQPGDHR